MRNNRFDHFTGSVSCDRFTPSGAVFFPESPSALSRSGGQSNDSRRNSGRGEDTSLLDVVSNVMIFGSDRTCFSSFPPEPERISRVFGSLLTARGVVTRNGGLMKVGDLGGCMLYLPWPLVRIPFSPSSPCFPSACSSPSSLSSPYVLPSMLSSALLSCVVLSVVRGGAGA